jgi:hypothetical protein
MTRRLRGMVLVLLVCLLVPACKSKVTKANFDKISEGMTLSEVEAILGEGAKQSDGAGIPAQFGVHVQGTNTRAEIYVWESGDKSITLTFRDGKVVHRDERNLR